MSSILLSVSNYAKSRGLVDDPFEMRRHSVIEIKANGSYELDQSIREERLPKTLDRGADKKELKPNYLVEMAEWMLCLNGDSNKFMAYWGSLEKVLRKVGRVTEADIVLAFTSAFKFEQSKNEKIFKDSKAALWLVPSINGSVLNASPDLVKFWEQTWISMLSNSNAHQNWLQTVGFEKPENIKQCHCMVTGAKCFPARKHGKVSGVPGSSATGASLTSYNEDVYAYMGRKQGENYPLCKAVAFGYPVALDDMLEFTGVKDIRKNAIITGDNISTLMWSEDPNDQISIVVSLFSQWTTNEVSQKLWESIEPMSNSESLVFVLTLRGTTGRISILGWDQLTLGEIIRNIKAFRAIVLNNAVNLKRGLVNLGKKRAEIQPTLYLELLKACLFGQKIPEYAISFVMQHIEKPKGEAQKDLDCQTNDWEHKLLNRMAFVEGARMWNERAI
jgi:hypothetical protein